MTNRSLYGIRSGCGAVGQFRWDYNLITKEALFYIIRFRATREIDLAEVLELEAVCLELLVVERLELVVRELVEFVEVRPPLVALSHRQTEIRVGDLDSHIVAYPVTAHCEDIHVVARDGALRGHDRLDDGGVNVRALARRDVDAHSGAAEDQRALKFTLRDLRADHQADAMEHLGMRIVRGTDADIGDLPALRFEVLHDRLFEFKTGDIRRNEQFLVFDRFHTVLLYVKKLNIFCKPGF